MRLLKLFLIGAVVLFLVITAFSFIFPSHLRISRAINMAAPRQKVWYAIQDFHTWEDWNQFISLSPLTGKSFSNPSAGRGAFLKTDQLVVRIVGSSPDSVSLVWDQVNGKPFKGGFNLLQLSADSLTVQWYLDFHFRWYPWEKFGSMVYDQKLGPLMEGSLAELKRLMENSP
ncbi:MAG: SRPBCC family protein [Puia sp.]|nr:SRPBCC family protein [Puia sp.]